MQTALSVGSDVPYFTPLTFPEIYFVAFSTEELKATLRSGAPVVFLGYSGVDTKQADFNNFLKSNFKTSQYSLEDYSILPLINSIWRKSRVAVDYSNLTPRELENENNLIEKTRNSERVLFGHGYKGKALTPRQIDFLMDSVKQTAQRGAEIKQLITS